MSDPFLRDKNGNFSLLKIAGLGLIALATLYLLIRLWGRSIRAEEIATCFVLISAGLALAIPGIFRNRKYEISAVRVAAWLLLTCLCALSLKLGWEKNSLDEVGINIYWVAIILIIVAALVVQAWIDSRRARATSEDDVLQPKNLPRTRSGPPAAADGHAQPAINANQVALLNKHGNIRRLIPAWYVNGSTRSPCVDICISDNNSASLPAFLAYKDEQGITHQVKTRIITNFGNAKPQVGRGHFISNDNSKNFPGTICCAVASAETGRHYVITCNHVMTGGKFEDPGKLGGKAVRFIFGDTYDDIGTWRFGRMNNLVDAAVIDVDRQERIEDNDVDSSIYKVSEIDCCATEIELKGAFSKTKRAFIIHINQPVEIDYRNETVEMTNLITVSEDLDHFNFNAPTRKGDSGSLVYHAHTRQPIGMVVGANSQFTFVLPMKTVLDAFPDLSLQLTES